MQMNTYIYGNSFYYHFDVRAKLFFSVFMSVIIFFIKGWAVSLSVAIIALILSIYTVGLKETFRGFKRILPIIIFLFIFSPLSEREWRPLIEIGSFMLLSAEALLHAVQSASRFISISYIFFLLMETERSENIVKGLRFYHLSYNAAITISLTLRYIPYLGSLYEDIRGSMSLRLRENKRGYPIMPTITALTISAVKMVPELASAMEERGFGLKSRRDYGKLSFSWVSFTHFAISVILPLIFLTISYKVGA